ncbi:MAG: spore cortex biosynthesis protein YabQ [Oscillospiraceae bacterium]|nr:spore cortex biosynthesis protein YabQ [Oscillospiraceae bacterium]
MNELPGFAVPISEEARLFLMSCLLGVPLGMLFDLFRTLRALLPHHPVIVFLEDTFFALCFCVSLQLYASAFGQDALRWYYTLGALLGLALWLLTLGAVWMRLLRGIRRLLGRILHSFGRIMQKTARLFVRNTKKSDPAEKIGETP